MIGVALVVAFTAILTNYLIRVNLGGALDVRRIPESGHIIVCGLGNIGEMFPDTDDRFKGVSSLKFLRKTADFIRKKGYEIGNIDSNILAQRPKLLPYFPEMQAKIAEVLGIPANNVHVKAKTMEHLGIVGAEEAIAAEAVALVFLE